MLDIVIDFVNQSTVCADADSDKETAIEFLSQCGAEFVTICGSEDMRTSLLKDVYSYPTTIFVDREGNITGDPVLGSWDEDFYRSEIETRLKAR